MAICLSPFIIHASQGICYRVTLLPSRPHCSRCRLPCIPGETMRVKGHRDYFDTLPGYIREILEETLVVTHCVSSGCGLPGPDGRCRLGGGISTRALVIVWHQV